MLHGLTMHTLELCSPRSPNYLQHHKLPTHRLEKTYAGGAPAARSAALHPARAPRLAGTLSSPPAAPPAPAAACGAWARVAPGLALSYTRSAPQPPLQMPPQPAGESARRCRPQQTSRAQASPLRQDHARPAARLAGAPSLRQPAAMIGGGAVLCLPRLRSRFLSAARPVRCQPQAAPRPWGCSRLRPRGDSAARWPRRRPPLRCARRRRRCPRRRLWTPRAGACAWQPRAPRQREQLAAQCTQAAPAQNTEWVSKRLWRLRILPQPPFPETGMAWPAPVRACAHALVTYSGRATVHMPTQRPALLAFYTARCVQAASAAARHLIRGCGCDADVSRSVCGADARRACGTHAGLSIAIVSAPGQVSPTQSPGSLSLAQSLPDSAPQYSSATRAPQPPLRARCSPPWANTCACTEICREVKVS